MFSLLFLVEGGGRDGGHRYMGVLLFFMGVGRGVYRWWVCLGGGVFRKVFEFWGLWIERKMVRLAGWGVGRLMGGCGIG